MISREDMEVIKEKKKFLLPTIAVIVVLILMFINGESLNASSAAGLLVIWGFVYLAMEWGSVSKEGFVKDAQEKGILPPTPKFIDRATGKPVSVEKQFYETSQKHLKINRTEAEQLYYQIINSKFDKLPTTELLTPELTLVAFWLNKIGWSVKRTTEAIFVGYAGPNRTDNKVKEAIKFWQRRQKKSETGSKLDVSVATRSGK